MAFKTISTVLTDFDTGKTALESAASLARKEDGHLDVICLGVDRTQPGFYHAGAAALAMQVNLEQASKEAQELERTVADHLEGSDFAWSAFSATSQSVGMGHVLSLRLRYSDLVVLPLPYGEGKGLEHEAITEAALFNAHVPVMVLPDEHGLELPAKRIVIAWNDGPEALRAIRRSIPFLQHADMVNIAIVDPPVHSPERSDPGGALSTMLSRHGVRAEVSVLAKTMPRVSDVIARHVEDKDADLLVMGAYGHSRFRESILGGSTRNMMEQAKIPVMMAH